MIVPSNWQTQRCIWKTWPQFHPDV